MKRGGTINVCRSIWDDEDFAPEPFTEREAFIWLVSEARYKDRVPLKRGEFQISLNQMADEWRWHKSRVQRFIARLETKKMITFSRYPIRYLTRYPTKIYFVNKYNEYQGQEKSSDTPRDTSVGHSLIKETKGTKSTGGRAPVFTILMEVMTEPQALEVWNHRIAKKVKLTSKTARMLVNQLRKCDDVTEAIDLMIFNGWKSVKKEWIDNSRSGTSRESEEGGYMEMLQKDIGARQ